MVHLHAEPGATAARGCSSLSASHANRCQLMAGLNMQGNNGISKVQVCPITSDADPPNATFGSPLLARLASRNTGDTEAAFADRRAAPNAARRPAIPRGAAPPAATAPAVRTLLGTLRICQRDDAGIVAVLIITPLPHIPVHVVQAPGVRLLLANGMCLIT